MHNVQPFIFLRGELPLPWNEPAHLSCWQVTTSDQSRTLRQRFHLLSFVSELQVSSDILSLI